jgi:hypothetical protein
MSDIKIFGYFDEWINRFITFHSNLENPYTWILPILYVCFSLVLIYYINQFVPRCENRQ